ncbi:MAG: nucleotidyltransferase family protein [Desulfuromusa sp.]|nr:nucleotidyltransferase family protein [Desulfuromusa sp.]
MNRLNAVIMAAGQSNRFGANKLLLPLQGKPVIQHLLDRFPFNLFHQVVLVYSSDRVETIAQKYPLVLCRNDHPDHGQGLTIRLGVNASNDAEGTLFLVADQPLLSRATIMTLIEVFLHNRGRIVMPVTDETPHNPVFFPKSCLPELKELQGDVGGKVVIKKHPELIMQVPFENPNEFVDIDTPDTYEWLTKMTVGGERTKQTKSIQTGQ